LEEEILAVRFTAPPEIGLKGTFTAEALRVMDVGTDPPPPTLPPAADPPPQPTKPRNNDMQSIAAPRAKGLRGSRDGSKNKSRIVINRTVENCQTRRGVKLGGAGSKGTELVVLLEEGARVKIVRLEVAAVPLLRLSGLGEKLHETPAGGPKEVGHARVTGLDALLDGVTVIVVTAELPAVMGAVS
jgi:hypothetical protein